MILEGDANRSTYPTGLTLEFAVFFDVSGIESMRWGLSEIKHLLGVRLIIIIHMQILSDGRWTQRGLNREQVISKMDAESNTKSTSSLELFDSSGGQMH